MKIFTIIGARPQFIKAAVVSSALEKAGVQEILVHTGQHFDADMSDIFFHELGLKPPAYHLGIGGLSHGAMTGRMLESIETLLINEKPTCVLVYGDTNSTLAGALAAAKLHIPIAHVEAGMRSFNRQMPEEINRVLVDHLSDYLFVTSAKPIELLAQEGITQGVHCVGDVMYDAVLTFTALAQKSQILRRLKIKAKKYGLVTLHRAENTDSPERLKLWLNQLERLAQDLELVFTVHPRTSKAIQSIHPDWHPKGILLVEPLGYLDMLALQSQASLVITDSGGLQKEALYANTPCLTLRKETEWVETLECGWNQLIGNNPEELVSKAKILMNSCAEAQAPQLYGDGTASKKIVAILTK
ncbi:UDP-N-acetylglucosamine 2-epimerase (non-hydrolyzing) [bacterium (Candidatus Blackallbacteria) CG17_big_fil_post_rev_8_21_14_2_50_48_46]|uniref:UDP-N-acetylglucosamine 2-epimerase (Non-hydrolyzing) n=1 Tax=bacterium (Candidatus Blackallbacteria) CG17_big_fil_post_rev_8_21_14_2_50_48_46 TaxID=2014261 RepID=A0A2M7FXJ4_9BACT|nr:MAG: UDP-N-acetylglucosamine 2-epimerase (non-hydrolyzing) [bacterium (Candidatus Blackallbacteria) CG18_big_fil_WC_8_21_14_2_50_49_26]PIW13802.1 MAG: UDP-N-acetylglucosamine 2-epimerase (non-hydrolyzing) [bacterium (Candidatus Blackallbacteria) CG17_big_fil_post_rev_8_21_14_2_50_48_46]PIW45028.1 MAG: UDP-N-acetylglucosamine 2-epimerase (non-hydrolyzing) [bacterium (Candidatus Blackallbacteria) CG13_big_fil_rev_8_21_14_2_50_49_14]